jgi:ligand-binding sensor domain-containing protein
MRAKTKTYSFTILFLFFCQIVFGQQLLFENYTSEKGLSQNSCYAIEQDSYGFMWFGTQDGLNRYDGKQFLAYSQQNAMGRNLPSNIITSLFYDTRKDLLWVGTAQGACIYNLHGDSLMKISSFLPLASSLENIPIKKIISFREDEYWFITFNYGLICLNLRSGNLSTFFNTEEDKGNVTSIAQHNGEIYVSLLYTMHKMKRDGLAYKVEAFHKEYPFPQIRELFSYNEALWIGTMAEGCYYIKDPVESKENIIASKLFNGGIAGFTVDQQNNLWVGARGNGIYRYNPGTNNVINATNKQYDATSICSNYSMVMFTDKQGILWCGFIGGIAKYDPLRFQFKNIDENSSFNGSLTDKVIVKMYTANDGSTFIGTLNKGIMGWDKKTNAFVRYPASEVYGNANNVIYDITEDQTGNIWTASCGGLMYVNRVTKQIKYYPEKKLPELNKMYAVAKLKKTDSLLIASENGLRFFSLKDKTWHVLPENAKLTTFIGGLYVYTARHIYEDAANALWICTVGSGLVRYKYLTNDFETIDPVKNISLFIRHLLPDGPVFWIATDNGLVIYDWQKNKILKHILLNGNGSSNVCYAIQKDNTGFYWVSTNLGLYKFNSKFELLQTYNTGNGLSFLEYNTACTLKDQNGDIYFGGFGGITHFKPNALRQNEFSPAPLITAINVNDKPWALQQHPNLAKDLTFTHKQNFLTIQFAVNNFSNEANNSFSYRLKGLNDSWSTPGNNNIASFTSLPPGDYTFELRAANSDGKWSNHIKTLNISILPAWWQTWWFYTLAILFLAALITVFVLRRIKSIRHEAALQQQMAEVEIKGLHAQMNPHFIFNSLNSIKEMILEDQKQNASRYLSKFAQLIRTSLEQSRQTFISVKQCIDHLQQYLEMEKLRFEDFSYTIETSEDLNIDEARIAPMLVQPLVENAIWHGLRTKKNDRKLFIRFFKKENQLICEVEDNGVGIRHTMENKPASLTAHRSVGITNIRERIALLNEKYNMKCSLSILDKADMLEKKGSGTVAILQLTV